MASEAPQSAGQGDMPSEAELVERAREQEKARAGA